MYHGWLWLSILNTTASPSPISMTPAFSPGPWMTHGAFVGSMRKWIFEDLYEQCSFHIAEKIPSSVIDGSRPTRARMRWYSSAVRPCAAMRSGLIFAHLAIFGRCLVFGAGGFLGGRAEDFLDVLAIGFREASLEYYAGCTTCWQ